MKSKKVNKDKDFKINISFSKRYNFGKYPAFQFAQNNQEDESQHETHHLERRDNFGEYPFSQFAKKNRQEDQLQYETVKG